MKKYVVCTILMTLSSLLCGQTYTISTIAGSVAKANGDSVNSSAAVILNPQAVVVDSAGNIYIADGDAHRVRKIDGASGVMTIVAGQGRATGSGDTSVAGINSPLNNPTGLALDPTGKILYIAERDNNKVKALDLTTGLLTTVVGYAARAGFAGDGEVSLCPDQKLGDKGKCGALYARIRNPYALATDSVGNIYIADRGNNKIRKVTIATGVITTVAGIGPINADPGYLIQSLGDGGLATKAQLARPEGVAVDAAGNVYISDTNNNRLRKVDATTGIITTVAGICVQGAPIAAGGGSAPAQGGNNQIPLGDAWPTCGPGTQATAASPVANNAANGKLLQTFLDGVPAANTTLNSPRNLAFDAGGNLYIADTGTNRIRVLNASSGILSTFAGSGTAAGYTGDGNLANRATLSSPRGVAVAANGDVYITDQTQGAISNASANGRLRVVDSAALNIRTVNANLYQGDSGSAANAVFNDPRGLSVDDDGNIYIADTSNQRIRKISPDGTINTVAGRGVAANAGDGGAALNASLNNPNCSAVDAANSLYIADRSNNRIRKVDAYGNISTIAGGGSNTVAPDGVLATTVTLNGPRCVILDNAGNLYIADTGNNAVRKVDTNGIITTVAGTWIPNPLPIAGAAAFIGISGTPFVASGPTGPILQTPNGEPAGDGGPGTSAFLSGPTAVALDPLGKTLYILDSGFHVLRAVNLSTGIISMVAGAYTDGGADGLPAGITAPAGTSGGIGPAELTRLNTPSGLAVDSAGNIYIADSLNYRVVKIDTSLQAYVIAGGGTTWGDNKAATTVALIFPRGIAVDRNGNVFVTEALGIVRKLTPVK